MEPQPPPEASISPEVADRALPEVLIGTPENFDALVLAPRGLLVVAYFWGHQCVNCEYFMRHLPALLEALRGAPVRIVKVNVYEHMALAHRFALVGVPAFLLVRDGVRLGKMGEFPGKEQWLAIIRDRLPEGGEEGAGETS